MTASDAGNSACMVLNDSGGMKMHNSGHGRNEFIEHEVVTNSSSTPFPASDELIGHHEIVNVDGTELLNLDPSSNGITALTDCNGTVFLLVTSNTENGTDDSNTNGHIHIRAAKYDDSSRNSTSNDSHYNNRNGDNTRENTDNNLCIDIHRVSSKNNANNRKISNSSNSYINSDVSKNSSIDNCLNSDPDAQKCDSMNSCSSGCQSSPQLQIINRDGIALGINANDLITTLDGVSVAMKPDEPTTSNPTDNSSINPTVTVTNAEADLSLREGVRNLTSVIERTNILTNSRNFHQNNSCCALETSTIDSNSKSNNNCTSNNLGSPNGHVNRTMNSNSSNSNSVSDHYTTITNRHNDAPSLQSGSFVMGNKVPHVPNWAMCLQDCSLQGDMFIGYVRDENEVDAVLNLYKKETQSLFAKRQTPSPAKDDGGGAEAVRLMWKSQYVPYDGIPFVNMGRRAIVMECEFGPRKRNNAVKRMMQMRSAVLVGDPPSAPESPILTCPVRLFVKKVLKFPQYQVSRDADAKVLRQLQEQSLKHVRESGFQKGEVRWYIQFPLPSSHRYHYSGPSLEILPKEAKSSADTNPVTPTDTSFIDSRVLTKIQQIVRQGFINPFLIRTAAKEFVENQMKLGSYEQVPLKHNKHFYPPLIEIQNIIQQTQAALKAGMTTPLPTPTCPLVTNKSKRKRTSEDGDEVSGPVSSGVIKKMVVSNSDQLDGNTTSVPNPTGSINNSGAGVPSVVSPSESVMASPEPNDEGGGGGGGGETISLTLTDSQLSNLSLNNFTYTQLAQLAKIGLLALNNATKDTIASQDEGITAQNNETADIKPKTEIEEGEVSKLPLPHNCSVGLHGASANEGKNCGKVSGLLSGVSNSDDGLGTSTRLENVDVVR